MKVFRNLPRAMATSSVLASRSRCQSDSDSMRRRVTEVPDRFTGEWLPRFRLDPVGESTYCPLWSGYATPDSFDNESHALAGLSLHRRSAIHSADAGRRAIHTVMPSATCAPSVGKMSASIAIHATWSRDSTQTNRWPFGSIFDAFFAASAVARSLITSGAVA